MRISGITYQGPQERDDELLIRLPDPLRSLPSQINGFILMGGALADFSTKVSKLPEGARISIQVAR